MTPAQRICLGMLVCLGACYSDQSKSPVEQEAAGRAGPPKKVAADAGATGSVCSASAGLDDWCSRFDCPRQLVFARPSLCENEMKSSLTAEELAPKHERAANSCGGESVTHFGHLASTRYDYDANGDLVGVVVSDPIALDDCAESVHTYGKSCAVTGKAERLCGVLCPAIACVAGFNLKLSAPEPTSTYEGARIEVCQNDTCTKGELASMIGERPSSGTGFGVYGATLIDSVSINLTLWGNLPEQFLELGVSSWDTTKMKDGDRYLLKLTSKDGKRLVDLSQTVDKYEIREVGAPCTQYCPQKTIDLRGMTDIELDAGAP